MDDLEAIKRQLEDFKKKYAVDSILADNSYLGDERLADASHEALRQAVESLIDSKYLEKVSRLHN